MTETPANCITITVRTTTNGRPIVTATFSDKP